MILEDIKLKSGKTLKRRSKCCDAKIKEIGVIIKELSCTKCGKYAIEIRHK